MLEILEKAISGEASPEGHRKLKTYLEELIYAGNRPFAQTNRFTVDFQDELMNSSLISFDPTVSEKLTITCRNLCDRGNSAYKDFLRWKISQDAKEKIMFKCFDSEGNTLINHEYYNVKVLSMQLLSKFDYTESNPIVFRVTLIYTHWRDKTL